jgi:hypothetical protein
MNADSGITFSTVDISNRFQRRFVRALERAENRNSMDEMQKPLAEARGLLKSIEA